MNVLEKILEEIERLEDPYYKDYVDRKHVAEIIRSHIADVTDTNVGGNDDYVMLTINEDGIAEAYDDTYDIVIHCESESEQKRVMGKLERYQGWIPVEERLPEDEKMVLVTCQTKKGIRSTNRAYYDGTFWHGSGSMSSVTAWQPLPEPYKPEEN